MEFEGLLLRKKSLREETPLSVLDACIQQVKTCFGDKTEQMSQTAIAELVIEKISTSIAQHHTFENPKKPHQVVAFAEVWGAPCWFILSAEQDGGVRFVITLRMHKDRDFGDELAQIRGTDESA